MQLRPSHEIDFQSGDYLDSFRMYVEEISKHPLLNRDEEAEIAERIVSLPTETEKP
jgi:hypothetical protein